MHRLVLVRHAKSAYPAGIDDHHRPLNERGRRDAPAIGRWIAAHVAADAVHVAVSTATRTQETWNLASAEAGGAWQRADRTDVASIYEAPVEALVDLVAQTPEAVSTLVVVGHNPGLVSLVAGVGLPGPLRDAAVGHFPTSTVAVLVSDQSWQKAIGTGLTVEAVEICRG